MHFTRLNLNLQDLKKTKKILEILKLFFTKFYFYLFLKNLIITIKAKQKILKKKGVNYTLFFSA